MKKIKTKTNKIKEITSLHKFMSLKWAQLLQIKAICLKRATYYIPPKGIQVLCALYKRDQSS